MKPILLIIAILALALLGGHDAATPYEQAVQSTLWIEAGEGHGSGVFIAPDLVITAHHVIKGESVIRAYSPKLKDGRVLSSPDDYATGMACTVIRSDPARDLALLRVKGHGKPIRLGRSPSPGDAVFAIGSSEALFGYSDGHVRSAYRATQHFPGQEFHATVVEHGAAVNLGDSGGPLVDRRGELVGINVYADRGRDQAYAAVDVSELRGFLGAED